MNKFILNVLLFLMILVSINILLFLLAKNIYYKDYFNPSLNYNSYLLADSHGFALNNLTEKYGIYNCSTGSDSYFDMYRKLVYLIHHTKINTLILTVDNHTLSPYREETNNLNRSAKYSSSVEFDNYFKYIEAKYIKYYIVLFNPTIRSIIRIYIFAKLKDILGFRKIKTNSEYNWNLLDDNDKIKLSEQRAKTQFSSDKYSYKLKQSLLDIVELCKQYNIKLVGIKFPLTSKYVKVLNNKTYNADKFLEERGSDVFDFTNIFLNNDEYFHDQDHLNNMGSIKFLELLKSKINNDIVN